MENAPELDKPDGKITREVAIHYDDAARHERTALIFSREIIFNIDASRAESKQPSNTRVSDHRFSVAMKEVIFSRTVFVDDLAVSLYARNDSRRQQ